MDELTSTKIGSIVEPTLINELFCYSGFFINISSEELNEWLQNEFSKTSDIKSLKRKQTKQHFLNRLKTITEGQKKWVSSFQYFINTKHDYFFVLNNSQKDIIKKYSKKNIKIMKEYSFRLDYWQDFYFNENFINCYIIDKYDKFRHYQFTKTKYEEKDKFPAELFTEKNSKCNVDFFIVNKENRNNKIMEKFVNLAPKVELENGDNMFEKLNKTFLKIELDKKLKLLEKLWEDISKTPELFIFGNDIPKSIKNYEVREIYCFKEFHKKILDNMDQDKLNFNWILFDKKNLTEYPELLKLDNYRGIIAKRYYVP